MTRIASFTPLQTLLLFQSLSVHGTDRHSFEKASESLRRGDDHADEDAPNTPIDLSPESLQGLYLALLKDEAKRELQERLDSDDAAARGADARPLSPRKRKIRSPIMPTIEEAKQHAHLIPRMIPRLYASYRARAIEEIRDEERRYDSLVRELQQAQDAESEAASHQTSDNKALADKSSVDGIVNHASLVSPKPNGHAQQHQEDSHLPPPQRTLPSQSSNVSPSKPQIQPDGQHLQPPQTQASSRQSRPQQTSNPPPFPTTSPYHSPAPEHAQTPYAGAQVRPPQQVPPAEHVQTSASDRERLPGSPYSRVYPNQGLPQAYAQPPYPQQIPQQPSYTGPQHRGGYMLPPFQVSPQAPSSASQTDVQKHSTGSIHSRQPTREPANGAEMLQVRTSNLATPLRQGGAPSPLTGPNHSHLRRSDVTVSPGSTTAWKVSPHPSTPLSATRPRSRSISPISDGEEETKATVKPIRPSRAKPASKAVGRARQSRGISKTPSTTATSARERTRSHSVTSHGDVSMGDDAHSIKNEVATPASFKHDVDTDDARSTRQSKRGGPAKRKRANTATTEEQQGSPNRATPGTTLAEEVPADSVVAVRNFAKVSAPILENIRRHKHASIFENPVKERDAEGYRDIIRRPQDFKSIRLAIAAGTRAVATALEGLGEEIPEGNTVTLPASEDLVPPKAIVNAAQLEQEIMRMLANAVMFNPGDDEIVEDAREMFAEAEQLLGQWRTGEEEETAIAAAAANPVEEEQGSKRRRLRGGDEDYQ